MKRYSKDKVSTQYLSQSIEPQNGEAHKVQKEKGIITIPENVQNWK